MEEELLIELHEEFKKDINNLIKYFYCLKGHLLERGKTEEEAFETSLQFFVLPYCGRRILSREEKIKALDEILSIIRK